MYKFKKYYRKLILYIAHFPYFIYVIYYITKKYYLRNDSCIFLYCKADHIFDKQCLVHVK